MNQMIKPFAELLQLHQSHLQTGQNNGTLPYTLLEGFRSLMWCHWQQQFHYVNLVWYILIQVSLDIPLV